MRHTDEFIQLKKTIQNQHTSKETLNDILHYCELLPEREAMELFADIMRHPNLQANMLEYILDSDIANIVIKGRAQSILDNDDRFINFTYSNSQIEPLNIYLAGPFFTDEETFFIKKAESILRNKGFDVFSPREHKIDGGEFMPNNEWGEKVFALDVEALDGCDVVVAMYHGMYSDTGTAWELGYAYANDKPVILVCLNDKADQSLMTVNGCTVALTSLNELELYDFSLAKTKKNIENQK